MVDLFPTVLNLAGVEIPEYAQGKDLVAWARKGARQPLHDCLFSQVGLYRGNLKTTWPTGLPESGRHPSLLQGARTQDFSYVRDPDYGDEAYDLRQDPKELNNLLQRKQEGAPAEIADLRQRVGQWESECIQLREKLDVVPGIRGFDFE
jgi:arylsulfatase A-like enzyme